MKTLSEIPQETITGTLENLVTQQTDTGLGNCKLSREQVKEAWGEGLLNDASYIWLAVQFMRRDSSFTLDTNEFCDIWTYEIDAGKYKRLKPETVRAAFSKWQSKGLVRVPEAPIQMELLF